MLSSYSMDYYLDYDQKRNLFDFEESYKEGLEMNIEIPLKLKNFFEDKKGEKKCVQSYQKSLQSMTNYMQL